ncbi:MAG: hypothetical protein RQ736_14125 [Thiogranum sp.]|nr:hypothetical protein [Thiogranum sp.]
MTTPRLITATVTVLLMTLSSGAFSAGYIKFDGVDGESKDTRPAPGAETKKIQPDQDKPAGLLLPAVQKAREASSSTSPEKGKVENTWKIEEGTR